MICAANLANKVIDNLDKEVCNGWVACGLLKLGSLEKTVIASLFHFGLHSGTIFCGKNNVICYFGEWQVMPFFDKKKTNFFYDFLIIRNFFWSNHFLIRCQKNVLLWRIHVSLGPKWKNPGSGVPSLMTADKPCPQLQPFLLWNKSNAHTFCKHVCEWHAVV